MADSGPPHTPEDGGSTLTTRIDYKIGLSYRSDLRAVPPQLKVLHNEDLLIDLFSFFEPHTFFSDVVCVRGAGGPKQSTLTALRFACLTCRYFFKPASDLLWRYMTSLTPLFQILPTFVKVNDVYLFTGEIESIHMERFRMYTGKIRGLAIRTLPENIADHCVHQLLTISNTRPFFSALKDLRLSAPHGSGASIDNFAPLFLIHGALLSQLNVDNITPQNESLVSSFLLHLSDKTPTIHHIGLYGELSPQISAFVKNFGRLRYVDLGYNISSFNAVPTILQNLGNLPDLHTLHLSILEGDVDSHNIMADTASMISRRTDGFQALNSLSIMGPSTSSLKVLQGISVAPGLRSITCHLEEATPRALIQEFIARMCRVSGNVENFTLVGSAMIDGPSQVVGTTPGAHNGSNSLSPFIHCRRLHSLRILGLELTTNDDSICFLCESGAWQNLRVLELIPSVNETSVPSLTTLRILAQNCPRLIDVTIPIDFKLHTPSSLKQECQHPRPAPCHPLESLFILQQQTKNHTGDPFFSIHMAGLVARFLEHCFPSLVGDTCDLDTDDEGDFQWWNVVQMVMEQLSSLRAEKDSVYMT